MPCILVESPRSGGSSTACSTNEDCRAAPWSHLRPALVCPYSLGASQQGVHPSSTLQSDGVSGPFTPARETVPPTLVRHKSFTLSPYQHCCSPQLSSASKGLMPAMAGDWPRNPRGYGSPQSNEPPVSVRTLPSVAELLSSRPSANSITPTYQHQEYFHSRSTPPVASLPSTTANATTTYWNATNHRQTSPPVSPTEQCSSFAAARPSIAARVFQEPQFRRQQVSKVNSALQHSALLPGVHNASHSTVQARQDSAIDQHRLETGSDPQLAKYDISCSLQSPTDSHRQPSPKLSSYQPTPTNPAYVPAPAPHQGEVHPIQAGVHHPARQHSKSLSSTVPFSAAEPRSHEHSAERTMPVDTRNGADPRPNNTGPSLPEQLYGHQNSNGTRQQRYNVRFAANYTSENMSPLQKSRNDLPTPTTATTIVAEPVQPRSSPAPVATTEVTLVSSANGTSHHAEPSSRSIRDTKDRGDREPSVERCLGCNEAWRRPLPDMDSRHISPAETNEEFMQIASNMIERLRKQNKAADAAYDDWRLRHNRCTRSEESHYRQTSPHSTGSVDGASRRPESVLQSEDSMNGTTASKRKSDVPHEPHSGSKQRKVTGTSPAPPVRKLEPDS